MFKRLVNEATLRFSLRADGPILVNEGSGSKIDPTLPDMSFVRCIRDGSSTIYLPGSSIKGVFRARYEQLMRAMGRPVCELFSEGKNCSKLISNEIKKPNAPKIPYDGKILYAKSCAACRFFGSLSLAGRVNFSDAYPPPDEAPVLGKRNGVGINRITGATHHGALFDIETLEEGTFEVVARLTNFALYQLSMLLWIIRDIDDGFVTFGMGGSRGNGQMRIRNNDDVLLSYKLYNVSDTADRLRGYFEKDIGNVVNYDTFVFGREKEVKGIWNIMDVIGIEHSKDIENSMNHERWSCVAQPLINKE